MKRIASLILCIALCLSFASCSKTKEKKQSTIGMDVEYYAKLGQIYGVPYALGQNVDTMLSELQARQEKAEADSPEGGHHAEGEDENFYYHNEEIGMIMTYGESGCMYRYNPEKKEDGIIHITSSNTSYGFEIGDVSKKIKDSLSSYGFKSDERELTKKEISYYGAYDGATALEYKFGENAVLFIFNENALFSTAIYVD